MTPCKGLAPPWPSLNEDPATPLHGCRSRHQPCTFLPLLLSIFCLFLFPCVSSLFLPFSVIFLSFLLSSCYLRFFISFDFIFFHSCFRFTSSFSLFLSSILSTFFFRFFFYIVNYCYCLLLFILPHSC